MKSLPPEQQLRLSRKIDAGKSITDAFDELEAEDIALSQESSFAKLEEEAASSGVPVRELAGLRGDPDRRLKIAELKAKYSKGGGGGSGRDDLIDRIAKVDGLLRIAQEESPDGGATVNAYASIRDTLIKQLQAQQLGIDAPAAVGAATGGAAVTGAATVTPGAAAAVAATTEPKATATAEPATPWPNELPLGRPALTSTDKMIEERAKKREADKAAEAAANMRTWTESKDRVISSSPVAEGTDPARLVDAAKSIISGKKFDGSTQEKQLATMLSDFAKAKAQGIQPKVLINANAAGESIPPAIINAPPGFALLKEWGMDPLEEIELPGQGIFGSTKTMKAWELMELRLDEIAQPLIKAQNEAQQDTQKAKLGSTASDILNKELGK
jgi:hypothetical protein